MTCHIEKCRNNTENTQNFYYSCIQVTLNSSPAHNNHTIVLWMTYFRLTASASMLVSVSRILHVARLLFCTATCRAEKKTMNHMLYSGSHTGGKQYVYWQLLSTIRWVQVEVHRDTELVDQLASYKQMQNGVGPKYLAFNILCAIIIC